MPTQCLNGFVEKPAPCEGLGGLKTWGSDGKAKNHLLGMQVALQPRRATQKSQKRKMEDGREGHRCSSWPTKSYPAVSKYVRDAFLQHEVQYRDEL